MTRLQEHLGIQKQFQTAYCLEVLATCSKSVVSGVLPGHLDNTNVPKVITSKYLRNTKKKHHLLGDRSA